MSEALKRNDLLFIDVRSPKEFAGEKIPGALNVALFNNEEQKKLGLIYKRDGAPAARRVGLEFASPKLPGLVDHILEITQDRTPTLYCWRGGLRSLSLSQILYFAGIPALRLKGGYKAYRRFIHNSLSNYRVYPGPVILHGLTGTGKTLIIEELITDGYTAINLEGLAQHRGSAFGKIGFTDTRSQKDFEALLWNQLETHKYSPYIVMEKEGRKIGPLFLPGFLTKSMEEGIHILLEAPVEIRAERIVKEYIKNELTAAEKKQFAGAIISLTPRLGKIKTKELIKLVEAGNYYEAALILCRDYYDMLYSDARPDRYSYSAVFDASSVREATDRIKDFIESEFRGYPLNKTKKENGNRICFINKKK